MNQSDTFVLRIQPPHAYVRAFGELDMAVSPRLDDELSAALAAGCSTFSIDFGEVTFCDASTIGVIANLERTLRATDGSLVVLVASEQVRYVFHIVGLDRLIDPGDGAVPGRSSA